MKTKIRKAISAALVFSLLIGILPAQAISNASEKLLELIRVEQSKLESIMMETNAAPEETIDDLFSIVRNSGEEMFSSLAPAEQKLILGSAKTTENEMSYWEEAGVPLSGSLSCVYVMHQTGLAAEQVLSATSTYTHIEDIIPPMKQLLSWLMEGTISNGEYQSELDALLRGEHIGQTFAANNISPQSTGVDEPQLPPPEINKARIAPYKVDTATNEKISLNTGGLEYNVPLVSVPGRSGLDLNLAITYRSSDASMYEPMGNYGYSTSYSYYINVNYLAYKTVTVNGYETGMTRMPSEDYLAEMKLNTKAQALRKIDELKAEGASVVDEWTEPYTHTRSVTNYVGFSRTRTIYYDKFGKQTSVTWSPPESVNKPASVSYSSSDGYSGSLSATGAQNYHPAVRTNFADGSYKMTESWDVLYSGTVYKSGTQLIKIYWKFVELPYADGQLASRRASGGYYYNYADIKSPTTSERIGSPAVGWTWALPSYDPNNRILNLGDGSSHEIENDLGIKDYPLMDMSMSEDASYTQTIGTVSVVSKWKLSYFDGMKLWFDSRGALICREDRFTNRINYGYENTNSGYRLNKIIDTSGRQVDITYSTTQIVVTLPDKTQTTIALKADTTDNARKLLESITDAAGRVTKFEYSVDSASFSLAGFGSANNKNANLTSIKHPTGAETQYKYTAIAEGMGAGHSQTVFKVSSRYDLVDKTKYAPIDYSYSMTYSGYPAYSDSTQLPSNYTYSTASTDADGLHTVYTFNKKGQTVKSDSTVSGVRVMTQDIEYSELRLPSRITYRFYGSDGKYNETISTATHNLSGRLLEEWSGATYDETVKRKITYSYDPAYGLLLSKTYYTDADTKIQLNYTLSVDKKCTTLKEIYENEALCEKTSYEHSTYGEVVKQHDYYSDFIAFNTIEYGYDSHGALVYKKYPSMRNAAGDVVENVSIQCEYGDLGRLTWFCDEYGNETRYSYNSIGDIANETINNARTTYVRNYAANVTTETDAVGIVTRYEYDPLGNEMLVWNETAGLQVTKKTFDSKSRLLTEQGASDTAITTYSYEYLSRTIEATARVGSTKLAQTLRNYNDGHPYGLSVTETIKGNQNAPDQVTTRYSDATTGNVVREERTSDGELRVTTSEYDFVGRKTSEKDARAWDENWNVDATKRWEYTYDGQIAREYNALGQYIEHTYERVTIGTIVKSYDYQATGTSSGICAIAVYDGLKRLIFEEKPIQMYSGQVAYGRTEYYFKAGQPLSLTRERTNQPGTAETWKVRAYHYNESNLLETITMDNQQYYFEYDKGGRTTLERMPDGSKTEYAFDDINLRQTKADPSGRIETSTYNISGQVVCKVDNNGVEHTAQYDGLGRTVSTTSGSLEETTTYALNGLVLTVENDTSCVEYQYNSFGDATLKRETSDGSVHTEYLKYNAAALRTSAVITVDGASKSIQYQYDRLGRSSQVEQWDNIASYEYDLNGNRSQLTAGNTKTTYTYNLANWVTGLTNEIGNKVHSDYLYTYRLDGNQVSSVETVGGKDVQYRYDMQGRLLKESTSIGTDQRGSVIYTYNNMGNRETMADSRAGKENTTNYEYTANSAIQMEHKKLWDGTQITVGYQYDPNGNQISRRTEYLKDTTDTTAGRVSFGGDYELLSYDPRNRLDRVETASTLTEYTYNPEGLRHSKMVNGERTTFWWDGDKLIYEADNQHQTWYIYGPNLL